MALLFVEGFDAIADYKERFGGAVSNFSLSSVTKRTGSQALQAETHSSRITAPVPSAPTSVIFGIAIQYTEALTTPINYASAFLHILTNTGSIQGWIWASPDGSLSLGTRTGVSSYPILGSTSAGVISINTWHYIEVKFTLSNSTSADDLIIKVDGVEVLNIGAGADTLYSGSTISSISFGGMYSAARVFYDDMYICDENGADNNDFLGDCKVETLYPDGNGNYDQFLGSDADNTDNYLHVDEAQHDGDSTYIEESTASERDSFTFDNMAVTPSSIYGISVCGAIKKDGSGSRQGKLFYRRSATDYDGTVFGPAESYQVEEEIWENDPVTTSPWTKTNIDASEFGIKVEA